MDERERIAELEAEVLSLRINLKNYMDIAKHWGDEVTELKSQLREAQKDHA